MLWPCRRRSLRCKGCLESRGTPERGEEVAGARLVGDVEDGDVGQAGAAALPKTRSDAPKTTAAQHSRGTAEPRTGRRESVALGHVQQVHVGEDGGGVHRAAAEAEAEAALGHGGEDVA